MRNIIQYPINHTDLLGAIKHVQLHRHSSAPLLIGGVHDMSLHMLEQFLLENVELVEQFCERQRIQP